ncbi:MAG: hypothetical protein IKX51_08490 [Bacteroidales bacterium]|nr:hypothetical protein [Bacteroidales bacterium]
MALFRLFGTFVAFDNQKLPKYNEQSPRLLAGASSLYPRKFLFESVEDFKGSSVSYFTFSYSMMCI